MSSLLANDIFYNSDRTAHVHDGVIESVGCQVLCIWVLVNPFKVISLFISKNKDLLVVIESDFR